MMRTICFHQKEMGNASRLRQLGRHVVEGEGAALPVLEPLLGGSVATDVTLANMAYNLKYEAMVLARRAKSARIRQKSWENGLSSA